MRRLINSFRAFYRSKFSPRFPFFALPRFQKIYVFPCFSMPCLGTVSAGPYLPALLHSSSSDVFNRSTFSRAFPFRIFPRLNLSQVFPHLTPVPHSPDQYFFPFLICGSQSFPHDVSSRLFNDQLHIPIVAYQVVTCFRAFSN